ncbi:MAG: LOG family protein [Acidimicrobiales bacterium]|nr:LOG family protein [Acidimicrobiales bacterium]RZV43475.1 MAG: LOG family protein [Acidimicrobiales bacterium]
MTKLPRYRTGKPKLDEHIAEIITEADLRGDDDDLVFEMMVTALRMGLEDVDRADKKLVNAALKELRYAFHVFGPYQGIPKCTIFGSARIKPGDPAYEAAKEFGAKMAELEWMVMTGAGPGIMAAGLEGAGAENSFGINIVLPFEASANEIIADDPKLINFRYFFTRKVTFMKESQGYAILPGGFGTMDEAFELLTLMQTGKTFLAPVVLLDPPGSTYWERWRAFVVDELLSDGLISEADMGLVFITNSVEDAANEVNRFYRTYHSSRAVGHRLVIRTKREIRDDELGALNRDFDDIIEEGAIERISATDSEIRDDDNLDLHRIAFRFNRHGYARLRLLIDALNNV